LTGIRRAVLSARLFVPKKPRIRTMAKANSILIKLVSSAGTGFYYTTRKNPKTLTEKMVLRKFDPVARKHVEFKEAKIK